MSEQMRIMRSKELPESSETELWQGTIWQGYKKNSAALKVPKSTVASIILKWKTFGTTRTLPRAGRPAKLSYRGKSLGERGKEEPKDHCGWAPEMHSGDGRKFVESQPSLQPSTSRGFMAEWHDGSLSSVQDTWKPAWGLQDGDK